jgi:hypothetical protein
MLLLLTFTSAEDEEVLCERWIHEQGLRSLENMGHIARQMLSSIGYASKVATNKYSTCVRWGSGSGTTSQCILTFDKNTDLRAGDVATIWMVTDDEEDTWVIEWQVKGRTSRARHQPNKKNVLTKWLVEQKLEFDRACLAAEDRYQGHQTLREAGYISCKRMVTSPCILLMLGSSLRTSVVAATS